MELCLTGIRVSVTNLPWVTSEASLTLLEMVCAKPRTRGRWKIGSHRGISSPRFYIRGKRAFSDFDTGLHYQAQLLYPGAKFGGWTQLPTLITSSCKYCWRAWTDSQPSCRRFPPKYFVSLLVLQRRQLVLAIWNSKLARILTIPSTTASRSTLTVDGAH